MKAKQRARPPSKKRRAASRLRPSVGFVLGLLTLQEPLHADLATRDLRSRFPAAYQQLVRSRPARLALARTNSLNVSDFGIELPNGFSVVRAETVNAGAATFWSPPRRLLMDRVNGATGRAEFSALVGGTNLSGNGQGVVVGVADSGADLTHPDLRDADGKTRVAWVIDFATAALGFYPELEERFGCAAEGVRCSVLGQPEIDALIEAGSMVAPSGANVRLPRDVLGHGTHVASIAAGGGLSNPLYTGVAPQATLVIAQIASNDATVDDAAVALAAQFIYDRADALGMPSVVNLSLGGDLGPHDGKSVLGDILRGFLDRPGRAMVVAAGNSGGLIEQSVGDAEVVSFGIHTRAQCAGVVRVPLLIPSDVGDTDGAVFVWVGPHAGDELQVGLEDEHGVEIVPPVKPGKADSVSTDRLSVTIINQSQVFSSTLDDVERGAVLLIQGQFKAGESFSVRLSGQASVNLWVQSEGGFGPGSGSMGVLFPDALRAGTITSPADTRELIAVGATLNRLEWPTRFGGPAEFAQFDPTLELAVGSPLFFSSLGPTARGGMKPDIMAPGAAVVAALSKSADPVMATGLSLFSSSPLCSASRECSVVDDEHAVGVGTSMASPVVAGAVALLLEQNPGLTQAEILSLIRASAERLNSSTIPVAAGIGLLNLPRALDALRRRDAETSLPAVPSAETSWLSLADDSAQLGSARRLEGAVHLRTEISEIADPALSDLALKLSNGDLLEPLERQAPGFYTFAVGASTSDRDLRVTLLYAGEPLLRGAVVTIAPPVQPISVREETSCAFRGPIQPARASAVPWLLAAALGLRRFPRRRAVG